MMRTRFRRRKKIDPELVLVEERLRGAPPMLDEAEMDLLLHRCLRHAAPRDRALRRTRLGMISALVLGFSFSGAGAGLAISGIGNDQTSAEQQYGSPTNGSGTLGTPTTTPRESEPRQSPEAVPSETAAPAQETRQLEADTSSAGELPFTGWAAAPIIVLGLLLLCVGLHLRRSVRLQ